MIRPLTRLAREALPLLALSVALSAPGYAQDPSPILTRVLEAQPLPVVEISPDRSKLLILERPALPRASDAAVPELLLAGYRINPRNNALSRARTFSALIVTPIGKGDPRRIVLPWQSRVGQVLWSPDGTRVAFTIVEDAGVSLWLAEASSGEIRMLLGPALNSTNGNPCRWMPSGSALLCSRMPAGRGPTPPPPPPAANALPETAPESAPDAAYDDLLRNPQDEAAFEYYFTSQLSLISLSGSERPVGKPGMYSSAQVSPDGRYLLVGTIHRPFSYRVSAPRFPHRTEVWDLSDDGSILRVIADRELPDTGAPSLDTEPVGPRQVAWRTDAPATLAWVEAQDGGNPKAAARVRDRILLLEAPFAGSPVTLADLEFRSRGVVWGRVNLAIIREGWERTTFLRTWIVDPSHPGTRRLLFERSTEDRYADPGSFVTQPAPAGPAGLVLSKDGRSAYLAGSGASLEGDRPFLDRLDLGSGKTIRLWRAGGAWYEEVAALLDPDAGRVLTQRESPTEPPNYFIRDLGQRKTMSAHLSQITRFKDPSPEFAGVTQQLLTYARKDGVRLSGSLYLPPGYNKRQGPLPFFYSTSPREFRSSRAASQVAGSPYRFVRTEGVWRRLLLLAGYGVLDGSATPIVAEERAAKGAAGAGAGVGVRGTAEGERDRGTTYVEQLVASAQAAVDKVVSLGFADPKRIAVGNPSSSDGAVMTAKLLAHSDLFRAGIAWSGEDAGGGELPPLDAADRLSEPLLLIHGMADRDPGTSPVPVERMYGPLKSSGAQVRLVTTSAESDGYRARSAIARTVYEMVTWLDRYVKGSGAP